MEEARMAAADLRVYGAACTNTGERRGSSHARTQLRKILCRHTSDDGNDRCMLAVALADAGRATEDAADLARR